MKLWGYKAWNIPTLPLTGMVGILFYLTQYIDCSLRTSFHGTYNLPLIFTDLHWIKWDVSVYLCPSVPIGGTSILPLITLIYTEPRICIPRICANPCSSVGGYISPCALRRNLINLWPRLSCAFSQFSEINCLTLSLAMLARYLNTRSFRAYPCPSVVGILSHRGTIFCGYGLTTEYHWTSLNQGYIFSLPCGQKSQLSKLII